MRIFLARITNHNQNFLSSLICFRIQKVKVVKNNKTKKRILRP